MNAGVLDIQRRMMELGRIRLGTKGVTDKGKEYPKRLSKFRLTSASRPLLDSAAEVYGGEVHPWENAPEDGLWELFTEASELDVLLPPVLSQMDGTPTLPYSQYYELWSAGGCQRRCDGKTEVLTGGPCVCLAEGDDPDERTCGITTRLNVMLPKVAGLGVWRLQTGGWNAASVLPGTLDLLLMAASQRQFIPAILRLEQRTKKVEGETHRFVVPVIDLPSVKLGDFLDAGGSLTALAEGEPPAAEPPRPELVVVNPPEPTPPKPTLPEQQAERPADTSFEQFEPPPIGEAPPLPTETSGPEETDTQKSASPTPGPEPPPEPPEPPEPTPDDERAQLTAKLVALAEQLDAGQAAVEAAERNRLGHEQEQAAAGTPELAASLHIRWLKMQIDAAESTLVARTQAAAS